MAEDEYEILSRHELKRLRDEIKALKEGGKADTGDLHKAIEDLNEKLQQMMEVFEAASEDLREEDTESELVNTKIDPILDRITGIEEQNKKIAEGLVAINDIVEEKLGEITETANALKDMQEELKEKMSEHEKHEGHEEHRFPAPPRAGPPPLSHPPTERYTPPKREGKLTPPPLPGSEEHKPEHKKKRFHLF
ncbi:hypothetical protein GF371_03985 [Candidatus Woesearchaeota archaeon]|nr:hypothetical protein [Candidatus Woesearchaeota archaeon]